jgi:hypothetical protein
VFGAIARFDVRFRWVILIVWIVAAPVAARTLPSLASVTQTSNAQFLPAGAPSAQADRLAAPFEGDSPASSAILVAYRPAGPLTAADQHALAGLERSARCSCPRSPRCSAGATGGPHDSRVRLHATRRARSVALTRPPAAADAAKPGETRCDMIGKLMTR